MHCLCVLSALVTLHLADAFGSNQWDSYASMQSLSLLLAVSASGVIRVPSVLTSSVLTQMQRSNLPSRAKPLTQWAGLIKMSERKHLLQKVLKQLLHMMARGRTRG